MNTDVELRLSIGYAVNNAAQEQINAAYTGQTTPIDTAKYVDEVMQLISQRDAKRDAQSRKDELDNLCNIYNIKFEPNGEFRSFGSLKPADIADFFLAVGVRIRSLDEAINPKQEES